MESEKNIDFSRKNMKNMKKYNPLPILYEDLVAYNHIDPSINLKYVLSPVGKGRIRLYRQEINEIKNAVKSSKIFTPTPYLPGLSPERLS